MRKYIRLKNIIIFGSIGSFTALMFFLFYEAFFSGNFRTTQDTIFSMQQVDLKGLRELKASGGTAIRFPDLKRRLQHIKENKVIIDGISEFHGYVKGIPTSFFAYQKPDFHWKYSIRRFVFTGTTKICPELVVSEADEAKKHGFSYINVKVGSKFLSSDETIDKIVNVFDSLPNKTWVHFHCHYGKGRTSIMLVMFDIMKNAPEVTLRDIVKRQYLLGSEDLLNTVVWRKGSYTKEQLEERKKFVEDFYKFVCQRKEGGIKFWSTWKQKQRDPNTIPIASTTLLH